MRRPALANQAETASDAFDLLCAIWILASNDENPIITYEGLRHRLGVPLGTDVRKLVLGRAELFRGGVPRFRLKEWKAALHAGHHLPSWLRDIDDNEQRRAAIDGLGVDDTFRSQFRTEHEALRSPVEIIDWGLQHIERLRKAGAEAREAKLKMWTGLWIPLATVLIAIAAVLSSAYLQSRSLSTQSEMKKYEVTFRAKQDAYTTFLRVLQAAFESAAQRDSSALRKNLNTLETTYFSVEPFLTKKSRDRIWQRYQKFAEFCFSLNDPAALTKEKIPKVVEAFDLYRDDFRNELYAGLFERQPETRVE